MAGEPEEECHITEEMKGTNKNDTKIKILEVEGSGRGKNKTLARAVACMHETTVEKLQFSLEAVLVTEGPGPVHQHGIRLYVSSRWVVAGI
jgi:hypothetical protein